MHTSVCRHLQVKQVYILSEGDVVIVTEGERPNSKNSRENSHEIIRTVLLSTYMRTYLDGSRSSGRIQLIERFFGTDWLALTVEGGVNL